MFVLLLFLFCDSGAVNSLTGLAEQEIDKQQKCYYFYLYRLFLLYCHLEKKKKCVVRNGDRTRAEGTAALRKTC